MAALSWALVACGATHAGPQGEDKEVSTGGQTQDAGAVAKEDGGTPGDSGPKSADDAGPPPLEDGGATLSDSGTITLGGNYASDGPVPYTVSHATLSNAGRSWGETIYTPTSPGLYPVVSLVSGTQQVGAAYAIYGKRLASYGIIALLQDDEGLTTPTPAIVDDLMYVIGTYVPTKLAGLADTTRVGLSGHSRGGKATLLAAEDALMGKVRAWFGLDPVDVDFLGTPGALPGIDTIGIPLGFAGATVSSNCSPASANYKVYYSAASPPAVAVTIEGAGHFDFLDKSHAIAEFYCTPEGTADATTALNAAAHYMMAFFARELLGDSSVGPAFGGADAQADISARIIAVQSK